MLLKLNTVYHGDCLKIMEKIDSRSIDMILCDLPYGVTVCKWDSVIPFDLLWKQYKRIAKPTTAIILMASQPFTSALVMSNPKMFKYTWVWVKNKKTNFLNAKKQPMRQTEDILTFYEKQCYFNPQKTIGHKPVNLFIKHRGDGDTLGKTEIGFSGGGQTDRYPSNCLYFSVVNNDNSGDDKLHPTQKPVALFEYLLKTYSRKGDLVLDNCAGSGTAGVACLNLNRKFILIEKELKYVKIIKQRLRKTVKEI